MDLSASNVSTAYKMITNCGIFRYFDHAAAAAEARKWLGEW